MQDIANLTDLAFALRTLAGRSPDDVASGLTEAAAQLDLAVNLANRSGDQDLHDLMQAALGDAELGIRIQLARLLHEMSGVRDVGRDTHILVQGVQTDVHALALSAHERFSTIDAAIILLSSDVVRLNSRADDGTAARHGLDERLAMLEAQMAGVQEQLRAGEVGGGGE